MALEARGRERQSGAVAAYGDELGARSRSHDHDDAASEQPEVAEVGAALDEDWSSGPFREAIDDAVAGRPFDPELLLEQDLGIEDFLGAIVEAVKAEGICPVVGSP